MPGQFPRGGASSSTLKLLAQFQSRVCWFRLDIMAPSPSSSGSGSGPDVDPVLRNAIRYTISAREYKTLHEWLIKQSPKALRSRAPTPSKYDASLKSKDDYNAAAVRASLRIFLSAQTGLYVWDVIGSQVLRRGKKST